MMKHVQSWLMDHQSQMADDLEDLCNRNSGSDDLPGLNRVADWLTDYFSPMEVPCEKIVLPTFETMDDRGTITLHTTGAALKWDVQGVGKVKRHRLLLNIHYDTVYGPK